jgi:opacity protein-like surface antigen
LRALLAIALLLAATSAGAEEPPPTEATEELEWTVQVDPLTTALGFVHLQIERRFADHMSVYFGPHLRLFSPPFTEAEDFVGYGAEIGVRWYVLGTAPRGWWALARGVAAQLRTTVNGPEETTGGGYGSLLGGYTFILGDWFVLSLGAGVQYLHYTIADLGPKGFAPAAHTAIGMAF